MVQKCTSLQNSITFYIIIYMICQIKIKREYQMFMQGNSSPTLTVHIFGIREICLFLNSILFSCQDKLNGVPTLHWKVFLVAEEAFSPPHSHFLFHLGCRNGGCECICVCVEGVNKGHLQLLADSITFGAQRGKERKKTSQMFQYLHSLKCCHYFPCSIRTFCSYAVWNFYSEVRGTSSKFYKNQRQTVINKREPERETAAAIRLNSAQSFMFRLLFVCFPLENTRGAFQWW